MNNSNKYPYFNKCQMKDAKRIFALIAELDARDGNPLFILNKYSMSKMVCYQCRGYDLTGSNCEARDSRRHFLVNNNRYNVYEIPMKSNKGLAMTGKFAVLFKNLDFGYWTFALMTHKIQKDNNNILKEHVRYWDIAEFDTCKTSNGINPYDYSISIHIGDAHSRCCRGFKTLKFDDDEVRKETGYHTTRKVMYKSFGMNLF